MTEVYVSVRDMSEPAWRYARERGWMYRNELMLWCWDMERVCNERR